MSIADRWLGRMRALLAALVLGNVALAHCETLVASDVSTRLGLGFRVVEARLQKWLPSGWQSNPPSLGPSSGTNLFLGFVDRLLNLDSEGKPIAGGRDRYLAIVVPARQSATGQSGNLVIRVFTGNAGMLPGAYKTSVLAQIRREQSDQGAGIEPGTASDAWEVRDDSGVIQVKLQYRRELPHRSSSEGKFFSPVQPDFFRIYRTDQGSDVVRSVPLEVNRVESFSVKVSIAELQELFDGTEQLISVTEAPWAVRQIFLP